MIRVMPYTIDKEKKKEEKKIEVYNISSHTYSWVKLVTGVYDILKCRC